MSAEEPRFQQPTKPPNTKIILSCLFKFKSLQVARLEIELGPIKQVCTFSSYWLGIKSFY